MKRQAACGTLGAALGVLAYIFSLRVRASSPDTHLLTIKIETRAAAGSFQSTFLSIMVIAGVALVCAVAVWFVARAKLT